LVDNIVSLAKQQGLSINELEKKAGVTNIHRWDDNRPSIDKVVAVARVLGVTVDELLREPELTPEEQAKRDLAERLGCPVEALEKLDPSDLDTLLRAKPRTEAV